MTTEELMKDRYKIIAPIPFKEEEDFWRVGEILDRDWGWHGDDEDGFKYHISDYPHLFKKLEWWEERKPEEMPKYLKSPDNKAIRPMNELTSSGLRILLRIEKWRPATAAEYEDYLSKNKTQ